MDFRKVIILLLYQLGSNFVLVPRVLLYIRFATYNQKGTATHIPTLTHLVIPSSIRSNIPLI
ncbi:hypothetical protein HanRHA438_Chr02g0060681 [Helianthus annuus]|nr:hypothetical protein HanRHA438_Chr02g0060681 [Helianthus annuus]